MSLQQEFCLQNETRCVFADLKRFDRRNSYMFCREGDLFISYWNIGYLQVFLYGHEDCVYSSLLKST